MKITFRLIISLLIGTGLVVFLFSYAQTQAEEKKLNEDLGLRSRLIAKSFKEAIEPFLEQTERPDKIRQFIEKFKGHIRLIGILVYLRDGIFVTTPPTLAEKGLFRDDLIRASETNESVDLNAKWDERKVYLHVIPLEKAGTIGGALGVIHDRTYILQRVRESWKRLAVTFSILALILSATTLLIIRWSVTGPIAKMAEWAKRARLGETPPPPKPKSIHDRDEVEKLIFEVAHMASSLKSARLDLIERSRLKQSEDAVWTKERLKEYLRSKLGESPLFVVANREPYIHRKRGNEIECIVPASGVVTALDPVLRTTGGVWVAHGGGDADRETVNKQNKLLVPPQNPAYSLKRVWLTEEEEKGYYYGFSNEGLWPLCHIAHVRPVFRVTDWEQYQKANEKFAKAILEELGRKPPFILIQDYHFALLPKMIKKKRPDAKIALFWHIPWTNPEAFGICPWREEILEGMLGSDVIGFHTQYHCNNFLDTVDRVLESRIDWTVFGVTRGGKTSYVRPFPISIAFPNGGFPETGPADLEKLREKYDLKGKKVGVGVDRIDYTKGLLERFRAIERVLEKYPEYQEKLVFIELGAPSRSLIESYQKHLAEVDELVRGINAKFGSGNYQPILFIKEHHSQESIQHFYRLADFCLVSSLHDGMNLVAKEFVAARDDEDGVLILSRFTGASHELQSAIQINPYHIEKTADAIHQSLTMVPEERKERMRRMRTTVQEYNVYRWAAELVTELTKSF